MELDLKCLAFYGNDNACAQLPNARLCQAISQEFTEDATMSRVKQTSKQKRTTRTAAVKVLGATGLSFSLLGSASASTMPSCRYPAI